MTDGSQEATVGQLTARSKDVRHKTKRDYFWQPIYLSNKISQGDSIFTGEKSSSIVTLIDGEQLQISQNSLVHFNGDQKELQINLAFGNVTTSGFTKPIVLTDCGQKYVLEPNKAQFEISKGDRCGSFQLQVKTGTVQISKNKIKKTFTNQRSGKVSMAETFSKNNKIEKLSIPVTAPVVVAPVVPPPPPVEPVVIAPPPEPVVAVVPKKVRLSTPRFVEPKRSILLEKNTNVRVTWKPVENAKSYRLAISKNGKFSPQKTYTVPVNTFNFTPDSSGTWFFKTQALAEGFESSSFSAPARVEMQLPPIQLAQAKFAASYQARSPADIGKSKKFELNWNEIPTAEKYTVEVATDPSFSAATKTEFSSNTGFAEIPSTGNYLFRVRAEDKMGRQLSSEPALGEIVYKKINQVRGPLIDAAYKSLSYYFQQDFGQFIWLRWNSKQDDAKYRVEVSKNRNFSKIDYNYQTNDTKVLIKTKIPEGEYFWRVRAETPEKLSAWSETAELKIQTK